jgi:hypothetical protein
MAVLSTDPISTRDTGILITYQKLNASLSAKLPTSSTLEFWGLSAYNTQLQPIEIADLGESWCAVDYNKFASLDDEFGAYQAIIEARKYYHPRAEIDSTLHPNLNIIGNQGDNLNRCLRILGMTLDVLYHLKPVIRQALKSVIERYMTYVTAYAPGPHSNISGEMYQAIASDFQTQVNTVYMCIYGDVFQSEEDVVEAFDAIPDTSHNSMLAIAIMQMRLRTPTGSPNNSRVKTPTGSPGNGKKPGKAAPKQSPKTKAPAATTPSPTSITGLTSPSTDTRQVCCFSLSETGCSKSPCSRAHRLPTEAEKPIVKKFFERSKLVQKHF